MPTPPRNAYCHENLREGKNIVPGVIESLPSCPIPELARLRPHVAQVEAAFLSYFGTGRSSNGGIEAIKGLIRANSTPLHRPRIPQPRQLPTTHAAHRRRTVQPPTLNWEESHNGGRPGAWPGAVGWRNWVWVPEGVLVQWRVDTDSRSAVGRVQAQVAALLAEAGVDAPGVQDVGLVLSELLGNVVRHAAGPAWVSLAQVGDRVLLCVEDRGRGFVWDPRPPADPLAESGRGLFIVSALAEQVRVGQTASGGARVEVQLPAYGGTLST